MEIPVLLDHRTFEDERGIFCPSPLLMNENNNTNKFWVQVNTSVSKDIFTLRGLHYQEKPFEQSKYLKVVSGRVINMIVCVDNNRPDFGQTFVFEIDQNKSVMVPRGFANGILTLEPNTVIQYFIDNPYSPTHEKSMLYSSVSEFDDIVKKYTNAPKLSDKDRDGFLFSDLPVFK